VQPLQHKSTSDPVGAPKTNPFGAIFIEFGDKKKCCTFSKLELVQKSRKRLIGALSCMHKGPKCIQTLWDHHKKIPFVETYKECAICAILKEKKPILRHSQRLRKVLHVLMCAKNTLQRPPKNANPSGLSERNVYSVCHFVDKVEISVLRRVRWGPQKSADFGATAPA